MAKTFFFLKTELPPDCGAGVLWRPSLVFFQADWSTKGYAFFTTRENADGYRLELEKNQSLPVTIELLENIPAYMAAAVDHVRSANKAYKSVVVYVDPPNLFCKGGTQPAYGSLEKFLHKNFQNELPWAHDVVSFTHERGCTIELLKDRMTSQYTALTVRGIFNDRPTMSAAIEEAYLTTQQVYCYKSDPADTADEALRLATEHIIRVAPEK